MEIWWKAITVIMWSSFKFMVGVFTALGFNFSFPETFMSTVGGGMLGVLAYLYVWEILTALWRKVFPKKKHPGGIKINKLRRIIVIIVRRYELYGIAALTPVLLSVPLGTILAASIEHSKWRIKLFMLVSFTGWCGLLFALSRIFGVAVQELF
ncbi:MAG: hypothetical protein ACK566_07525 [Bacteroidota bacterium]